MTPKPLQAKPHRPLIVGVKVKDTSEIPAELNAQISEEVMARMEELAGTTSPIKIYVNHPMTWKQVKETSRLFTKQTLNPVLVLPKISEDQVHPGIRKDIYSGYYCEFEAQVMTMKIANDKNAIFDIAICCPIYSKPTKTNPDIELEGYRMIFPDESSNRINQDPELAFGSSKHVYGVMSESHHIVLFSDMKLELGIRYRIRGLMLSAPDRYNHKGVVFKDAYMLLDSAVPIRNLLKIDAGFFKKFKGLNHDQFVNSCAFPFENSLSDYKELIFVAMFYIRSAAIPFNVMLLGMPGCTKSGFLSRAAAVVDDELVDCGSGTLKGIIPSFSVRFQHPGALATAKYFVCLNEFFEVVRSAQRQDDAMEILSKMKQLLEGDVTPIKTGNGSMDVIMRASLFAASNWPTIGRDDKRITSISDLYSKMDPALLDRIMLYPVPQEAQMKLKNSHFGRIQQLFSTQMTISKTRNKTKLIELMPSPYLLHTYDLRTLIAFKETLGIVLTPAAIEALTAAGRQIQSRYSYERYTRAQDFISNIASAYAFERALSQGKVQENTTVIQVETEDVREAMTYYMTVLERHQGGAETIGGLREEFLKNAATMPQRYILRELADAFRGLDKEVPVQILAHKFKKAYPEADWNIQIRPLIEHHLAVFDGNNLMWIDPVLDAGVIQALSVGGSAMTPYVDVLYRNNLVDSSTADGLLHSKWVRSAPRTPSQDSQTRLIDSLRARPMSLNEIKKAAGADEEDVENSLNYLVLANILWRENDGRYSVNPNAPGIN